VASALSKGFFEDLPVIALSSETLHVIGAAVKTARSRKHCHTEVLPQEGNLTCAYLMSRTSHRSRELPCDRTFPFPPIRKSPNKV